MELSEIELKHTDTKRNDAAIYVNTIISTESVAHETSPKSADTGESEGYYETLRFGTKQNEADRNASRSVCWEDLPNRMKYAVFVIMAVTIVLFVVDIVVIVFVVLPKSKVDGNWIQWSPWSNCDVACNNGTQTRMRFCINPAPSNGGIDCSGKSTDTKQCENDACSDGGWSSWGSWGTCSDNCDGGVRSRLRTCTNPRPSLLGRYCDGSPEEVILCNRHTCSDGGWSGWDSWGSCSYSCGGGVRTRLRTCTNPRPSLPGRYCVGSPEQVMLCNKQACPVDGNWIQWSPWSHCDVTCNSGTQTRMRFCINPAPSNGGIDCSGKSIDTKLCENDGCSNGGWSSWGSWGSCSDSCDGGVRSRLRTCTNPRPSLLGRYCDGNPEQMMPCNKYKCSDGGWSNWGSWGSCSDSCGEGVRSRLRTCTNPRPSLLGRYCDGSPEQVMPCNKQTCPDHKVAFTAYGSSGGTSNVVIKFPSTILNIGGGYSTSTGRFTCKIPGIYNFAVTLTKIRQDIDLINAYLRVNGSSKLMLHSDPDDNDKIDFGSYSLSVTGNFHLNKNDYVYVYGVPSYFYSDYKTSFTGVLVIPDE